MKNTIIYLTGFMGSGKTTVGTILAEQLNYEFFDLDVLIEDREKRPITAIFKDDGESYFRSIEKKYLHEISESARKIISLGGGALIDEGNRKFTKSKGMLVYLTVTPDEIYERIKHAIDRPLLLKDDNTLCSREEFSERIEKLFEQRESGYLSAHVSVNTVGKNPVEVVQEILSHIK
ncbi:shikimate kinase [candidate division KSB1 bacterium]